MTGHPPCPDCRGSRFRTVVKGKAWECRNCGLLRDPEDIVPEYDVVLAAQTAPKAAA